MSTTRIVDDINSFLQAQLRQQRLNEVSAVEAARWLDAAGVLKDSDSRPGLPLRNLLGMLTFTDDDFRRQLQQETSVRPEWAAEAFTDLDEDVRQNIARIKGSPFIPKKDMVRGFVYEVETGRLREVT